MQLEYLSCFFPSNNHSLESVLKHVFQKAFEYLLSLHRMTHYLNDKAASCSYQRLDPYLLVLLFWI